MSPSRSWWRWHAEPAPPPPAPPQAPALPPHGVRHVAHDIPSRAAPGLVVPVRLVLENTGSLTWRSSSPAGDFVGLAVHWDGRVVANHMMPRPEVRPGESVTLRFALEFPMEPGPHRLDLKMVQYQVAVFEDRGVPPLTIGVTIEDETPDDDARYWDAMQRLGPWHYLPTRGIARGRDGSSYPVFVKRAQGAHVFDLSNRRYVDYTMGWGTVLLGHAHPKVSEALRAMLVTGPTVSLPQPIEFDVAERLVEDFHPGGMICFAKNGSDACTFAARMARVLSGRQTILFSGYHGWQDFWVEQVGFERTGVPPREPQRIFRFPFHDLAEFRRLLALHRADLAAVMIEPSPWAGDGLGFEPDTDPAFLKAVETETRGAGALFILDEIVTGYRYPERSVARAKGVSPDLTCLGKAIASGLPLSAVVGRADVFKLALPRSYYAATFHAESYSFAAAKAAIDVYRSEPVAAHVWDYGRRLKDGVLARAREQGVETEVWGPPFRMSVRLPRADRVHWQLERTLLQQELLRNGIVTNNGVMLPSFAHDDATLAATMEAFGRAFEVVARTARRGDWDEALEIPPLIDL